MPQLFSSGRAQARKNPGVGSGRLRLYTAGMIEQGPQLRRGWTTGTCATAAAKAAYAALLTGAFPDPVEVTLPHGERPSFASDRACGEVTGVQRSIVDLHVCSRAETSLRSG